MSIKKATRSSLRATFVAYLTCMRTILCGLLIDNYENVNWNYTFMCVRARDYNACTFFFLLSCNKIIYFMKRVNWFDNSLIACTAHTHNRPIRTYFPFDGKHPEKTQHNNNCQRHQLTNPFPVARVETGGQKRYNLLNSSRPNNVLYMGATNRTE